MDEPDFAYRLQLENRLCAVRWLTLPALLATIFLLTTTIPFLVVLSAVCFGLANFGISNFLYRIHDARRLKKVLWLAVTLDWLLTGVVVFLWAPDAKHGGLIVLTMTIIRCVADSMRFGAAGLASAISANVLYLSVTYAMRKPTQYFNLSDVYWVEWVWIEAILFLICSTAGVLLIFRASWLRQQTTYCVEQADTLRRLQQEKACWNAERRRLRRVSLRISERELQLLPLLACEGLTYDVIAERLCISTDTVKTHVHRLGMKLGVTGRQAVVVAAHDTGILDQVVEPTSPQYSTSGYETVGLHKIQPVVDT